MALVGTSLNAVSSAGYGVAIVPNEPKKFCTAQIIMTGFSGQVAANVDIQYSLDGVNFGTVQDVSIGQDGTYIVNPLYSNPKTGGPFAAVRAYFDGTAGTITVIFAIA